MVSEAQKRAKAKYDLKTTQFVFRFRNVADADVIAKLNSIGNNDSHSKTEYVRQLIRRDIDGEK